jgi:hypothetical protein
MATPSLVGFDSLAALYNDSIDSGEFIVMVAAVESASHDGRPSFCAVASLSIFLYSDSMFRGAGMGPGRACAALMSALRPGASLDMAVCVYRRRPRCNGALGIISSSHLWSDADLMPNVAA